MLKRTQHFCSFNAPRHVLPRTLVAFTEGQNLKHYFPPSFIVDEWGPCSAECGEGVRRREVACKIFLEFSKTVATLPDEKCPGPKPAETQLCFAGLCDAKKKKSDEGTTTAATARAGEPQPSVGAVRWVEIVPCKNGYGRWKSALKNVFLYERAFVSLPGSSHKNFR